MLAGHLLDPVLRGWDARVEGRSVVKGIFRPAPEADGPLFWFMMQVGLMVGFATTLPMNRWQVRIGLKFGM